MYELEREHTRLTELLSQYNHLRIDVNQGLASFKMDGLPMLEMKGCSAKLPAIAEARVGLQ